MKDDIGKSIEEQEKISDLEKVLNIINTKYGNQNEQKSTRVSNIITKMLEYYFRPKSFEKKGKFYEFLGTKKFIKLYNKTYGKIPELITKKIMNKVTGVKIKDIKYMMGELDESLKRRYIFTIGYESTHLVALLFFTFFTAINLALKDYVGAAELGGANLIINVYPIMTNRYIRARIENLLERRGKKTKYNSTAEENPLT